MIPTKAQQVLAVLAVNANMYAVCSTQISHALKENGSRVMDLFREWDTDGDGNISKKEFLAAMPKLGLEVDKQFIIALFDEWDADGGGTLDHKELQKILRTPSRLSPGAPGATPKKK